MIKRNINIKPKKGEDIVQSVVRQVAERRSAIIDENIKNMIPGWEYRLAKSLKKYPKLKYVAGLLSGLRVNIWRSPSVELFEVKRWGRHVGIFKIETNFITDKK